MQMKNSNIKNLGLLIILLAFVFSGAMVSSQHANLRESQIDSFMDLQKNSYLKKNKPGTTERQSYPDNNASYHNYNDSHSASPSIVGGVSKLMTTVGKSQFVRFDEPVTRISITNPELADVVLLSPKELLVNGKESGSTSLLIWGDSEDPVFIDLIIEKDSSSFLNAVQAIAPNEKLDLKFTDKSVILSGKVSSSLISEKIKSIAKAFELEFIDVSESPTPQVLLEVKVVEASRSFAKNLAKSFSLGNDAKFYTFGNTINGAYAAAAKGKAGAGVRFEGGSLNAFTWRSSLTTALSSAESEGLVKILAEPKLVTTNKNKASFNSGLQVPVPASIGEGGNIAYDFKDTGVNVAFTPTILEKSKRISLNIQPEVNEIDSGATIVRQDGTKVFGFKSRKAETTVELNNGQTLVIAGLIEKTNNRTNTKHPILGSIPIIGKAFDSYEISKYETELLIFVTPKIIEPAML